MANSNDILRRVYSGKTGGRLASPQNLPPLPPATAQATGKRPTEIPPMRHEDAVELLVENLVLAGLVDSGGGRDRFTFAREKVRCAPATGVPPSDVTIQLLPGGAPVRVRAFSVNPRSGNDAYLRAVAYAAMSRLSGPYLQVCMSADLRKWARGCTRLEDPGQLDHCDPHQLFAVGPRAIFDCAMFRDALEFYVQEAGGSRGAK